MMIQWVAIIDGYAMWNLLLSHTLSPNRPEVDTEMRWRWLKQLSIRGPIRMFFLRQLKSFHVNQNIMINFYSAVIESCITCSIIIWFMAAPKKETISLTRAVKIASYIIGKELNRLVTIYQSRIVSHVTKIMKDELHPLSKFFNSLSLGKPCSGPM